MLAIAVLGLWHVLGGSNLQEDTAVTDVTLSAARVSARNAAGQSVKSDSDHILFGDLHVHTTWSVDAFLWSLPMMGGEGAHPPADACDFARFCSQLDFYSLTDHAEALNPRTWNAEKESVRQCNAVTDGVGEQDLFAFMGFEWTQIGATPEEHFGHKNVIFKHTDDARLPARPIGAVGVAARAFSDRSRTLSRLNLAFKAYPDQQPYLDVGRHVREIGGYPVCSDAVSTRDLPLDCRELAATPRALFDKLDDWGFDSLVIPHGTTWGFYTPNNYVWDKQLSAKHDDPERQRLVEVFSGHGNSEEYREYRALAPDGSCPEPTAAFEPCCWRAGEIIRSRCDDPEAAECEARVEQARADFVAAGVSGYLTVPGAKMNEWKNCGQCTDCFEPAFTYRPGGSVQYMLARGNFDDEAPRHHTFGFIASSDNHSARPGTGYKEFARKKMSEARGSIDEGWYRAMFGERGDRSKSSKEIENLASLPPWKLLWFERQASFFLTGGLVAVHAKARTRDEIWDAMMTRSVYGTSGDRILLWFDLVNGPDGKAPMGSTVSLADAPRFQVKAAGAFAQLDGCPAEVQSALGAERLARVCAGECYNPSDIRRRITQIEVVRIQRQSSDGESVAGLIEDPWRVIPCPEGEAVCDVSFQDASYVELDREVLYYVRAIQEPTAVVNAGGLRCTDTGECDPCYGDYRTPDDDDCLTLDRERAWSSPIYLRRN